MNISKTKNNNKNIRKNIKKTQKNKQNAIKSQDACGGKMSIIRKKRKSGVYSPSDIFCLCIV